MAALSRADSMAYIASNSGSPVPASAKTSKRAFYFRKYTVGASSWEHEECTSPIFNYARFLPWTQAVETVASAYHYAALHAESNLTVNPDMEWTESRRNEIHSQNRVGTCDQVENYCRPPRYTHDKTTWSLLGKGVLSRFLVASALALLVQWSTAGAAISVVWFTPTRGEPLVCLS